MPVLILLVSWLAVSVQATPQPPQIEGDWIGTLAAGGVNLRLAFHVARDPAGQLAATMDSLDQGAMGLKIETVNVTGDVQAGVDYLKTRKEVDPKRIGLIGHSEGGLIAPIAATRSSDVAFVVLMAGPGLPGEDILYLQAAAIAKANGASDAQVSANRALQEQIFRVVKDERDPAAASARLRQLRDQILAGVPEGQQAASRGMLDAQMAAVSTPWFRYFLSYDPRAALSKVTCPVLAIAGERDLQVPYERNLEAIGSALKAGGNTRVTLVHLPGLNHLFQTATTGSPSEYMGIEETMSPAALTEIGNWIHKVAGFR